MPAADPNTADTVINEALVELGVDPLGDTWQGSRASEAGRAVYDTVLRGMHASAQWNFARRQRQLDMRADAIGNTPTTAWCRHRGATCTSGRTTACIFASCWR
jgi:hypothetical protein